MQSTMLCTAHPGPRVHPGRHHLHASKPGASRSGARACWRLQVTCSAVHTAMSHSGALLVEQILPFQAGSRMCIPAHAMARSSSFKALDDAFYVVKFCCCGVAVAKASGVGTLRLSDMCCPSTPTKDSKHQPARGLWINAFVLLIFCCVEAWLRQPLPAAASSVTNVIR